MKTMFNFHDLQNVYVGLKPRYTVVTVLSLYLNKAFCFYRLYKLVLAYFIIKSIFFSFCNLIFESFFFKVGPSAIKFF